MQAQMHVSSKNIFYYHHQSIDVFILNQDLKVIWIALHIAHCVSVFISTGIVLVAGAAVKKLLEGFSRSKD